MVNETELQSLLSAVTDALLDDSSGDVDDVVRRYAVPRQDVEGWVSLIRRLHLVMVGEKPSQRFVKRLKADLLGTEQRRGVVYHVRHLPPRVQIAAGIALVVGFMLFTRHRMLEDFQREHAEVSAVN